jgi:LuxR family maltose regulon positive regulatory protein
VTALWERTEGWAGGLYLAALSLRDRTDRSGFIATFAGDHRHVVDYLGAEVLDRQPEDVRRFFLLTSILDRLSGPLCDVVVDTVGSDRLLEECARTSSYSHSTPRGTGTATTTSSATCSSTSSADPNPT